MKAIIASVLLLVVLALGKITGTDSSPENLNAGIKNEPKYFSEMPVSELVRKKLSEMTLREKIAQMVISNTIPENFSEGSSEFKKLKRLCTETKVGGFIFFKGSCSDYARLSNKLQEFSETPLLISSDFERGTGMRITDGNLFPNNMAIGAGGNTKLAYEMGLEISRESKLLGVQQIYAPVCDVNNNPKNPIINVRSYGEDPVLVSRMSEATIKGMQDGNCIATAKHFPGHGDTDIDSHQDLPVLNFSMDRLNQIELVPFKNAIDKNVMSVMVAHLSFPVLETNEHIPASLSQSIVQGLLIDQLGFKGLVVTDALNMKGITKYFSNSEVAIMCVNAGIDLILMNADEEGTISAIENAVNKGSITEERINRSAEKILKAKEWAGLFKNRTVDADNVYSLVHTQKADELNVQIADESITVVKDDQNAMPIKDTKEKIITIGLSDGKDNINSSYFFTSMTAKFPNSETIDISSAISGNEITNIFQGKEFDHIVVGIFAKIRFGTGKISILPSQVELLNSLKQYGSKVIIISFGNPYLLSEFQDVSNYVCAYGDADVSIDSAIKAITGQIKTKGKLPVSISDKYQFGIGLSR